MDFFEKLSKKATDTYKCVEEKTNKMAVESKIKSKMNDCKSKISVIYNEIGKKVYQKHTTDGLIKIEEDIQEELSRIDELCKEIENSELELLNLAGQKRCINCKEEIQSDANFCPSCGVKQPEKEETNDAEDKVTIHDEGDIDEADDNNENVEEDGEKNQDVEQSKIEEIKTEVIEQFIEDVESIEDEKDESDSDKEEITSEKNENIKNELEENK